MRWSILWYPMFLLSVWSGCELVPLIGNWVFAIPAAGVVAYILVLRTHFRRWLRSPTPSGR